MNKLMITVTMAAVLPVVSLADMPNTTYVVPADTAGNTPTEPYDTWAKAANVVRTATDVTATNGLVLVAGGDYSGSSLAIAPKQAVEMQIVDSVGGSAPGTATLGVSTFFTFAEANTDPNLHALTVSKGTIKTTKSQVFTDGVDVGSYGASANFLLTLTGADTHLDFSGKPFYCGWSCRGTTVRISDSATVAASALYIGQSGNSRGATVVVDSGASVTSSGELRIGEEVADCALIVSNGYVNSGTVYVGKSDADTSARLVLAGGTSDGPVYRSNQTIYLRQGSTLELNVAEAPVAGYSPAYTMVYIAGWNIHEAAKIELSGLAQLKTRLRAAGKRTYSTQLICKWGGDSILSIPASVWAKTVESASAVLGFSVSYSGPYMTLSYKEPGYSETFVVEAGTEGNVPTEYYDTWATAANNVLDAATCTEPGGTVTVASGTYLDGDIVGDKAVNIQAVVSSEDETAGVVTLRNTFFKKGTTNVAKDPLVNSVTLKKGTFNCSGSTTGVFVENSGVWGAVANCRFNVTGAETVFNAQDLPFYIGFSMQGTEAMFTDGATANLGAIYVGESGTAANSGLLVLNGARVNGDTVLVGQVSNGDFIVVSNATLSVGSFTIGDTGTSHGENMTIGGSNAVVSCSGAFTASGNATLRFDVADAPVGGGYATPLLRATSVKLQGNSSLKIVGAFEMLARIEAKGVDGRTKLVLAEATGSTGALEISDEQLAAARADLPENATLACYGKKLILKIGKPLGLAVIVR